MSDSSFLHAISTINGAARLPPSDATKFLFDHYRISTQRGRDAFVLALIGEVVATQAFRATAAAVVEQRSALGADASVGGASGFGDQAK